MLYNYQEIFVCMLLLPVVVNFVIPLGMLAVWLLKYLLVGKRKPVESDTAIEQNQITITA